MSIRNSRNACFLGKHSNFSNQIFEEEPPISKSDTELIEKRNGILRVMRKYQRGSSIWNTLFKKLKHVNQI